ncbi:MAG: DUF421 domain-containing protein [Oscillospiraceae bacterium]|nr:DUF421 domain-containing protein [Oscillospiraceae bacterium]
MLTAMLRTVILYLLLIAGLRLTGKRQLGELEPVELVLAMLLSDLAAVPMQDLGIPLLQGVVPIVTLLALSTLLSYGNLRSERLRRLICGSAAVIIEDGQIRQQTMRSNRLTVDELLEELRAQGIPDPAQVQLAVLESSGALSVFPRSADAPVTPRQLGLTPGAEPSLPTVVVSDGRVLDDRLRQTGHDRTWLQRTLKGYGAADPRSVFFLTVDGNGQTRCVLKEVRS